MCRWDITGSWKMKKILYVFAMLFVLSGALFAQSSKTVEIIAVSDVYEWNRNGNNVIGLEIRKDGSVHYFENDARGDEMLSRKGKYYIDENNLIHIIWNNGYEEDATLTYDSNTRRATIEYNDYTLEESYETR